MVRLLALFLLVPASVPAQTFGLHLGSVHVPDEDGQENLNQGLYVRSASGLTAGAYRNSMGRWSTYGGWTWDRGPFGLTLGIAYGYQRRQTNCRAVNVPQDPSARVCDTSEGSPGAFAPFVSPSARLPAVFGLTPRLSFVPVYKGSSVVHLSIEKPF